MSATGNKVRSSPERAQPVQQSRCPLNYRSACNCRVLCSAETKYVEHPAPHTSWSPGYSAKGFGK